MSSNLYQFVLLLSVFLLILYVFIFGIKIEIADNIIKTQGSVIVNSKNTEKIGGDND